MFTGLIEEVGTIVSIQGTNAGSRLRIQAPTILEGARLGDSIAIDGACTTVVAMDGDIFDIEASPETLEKTTFGTFEPGTRVNLERPLTPSARLGGHFVTGHVDGTATITERRQAGNSWVFRFRTDNPELARYLVPKVSVTVNGISLTVNEVQDDTFTVAIIPHTMQHTNLGRFGVTDRVNIETDLLGKYVERLLTYRPGDAPTADPLAAHRRTSPATMTRTFVEAVPGSTPVAANIRAGEWFNSDDLIYAPLHSEEEGAQ